MWSCHVAFEIRAETNPLDTGRKVNVHKTFRRRPGSRLNAICTFSVRPVSRRNDCYYGN